MKNETATKNYKFPTKCKSFKLNHEERKMHAITGTGLAAIMGMNKYKSATALYNELRFGIRPKIKNPNEDAKSVKLFTAIQAAKMLNAEDSLRDGGDLLYIQNTGRATFAGKIDAWAIVDGVPSVFLIKNRIKNEFKQEKNEDKERKEETRARIEMMHLLKLLDAEVGYIITHTDTVENYTQAILAGVFSQKNTKIKKIMKKDKENEIDNMRKRDEVENHTQAVITGVLSQKNTKIKKIMKKDQENAINNMWKRAEEFFIDNVMGGKVPRYAHHPTEVLIAYGEKEGKKLKTDPRIEILAEDAIKIMNDTRKERVQIAQLMKDAEEYESEKFKITRKRNVLRINKKKGTS